MSASYRVDLDVGPLSWSITRGAAPQLPEVLAPLRTGWTSPDSDLWPVQPDPQVLVFSVLAESAEDLAAVDLGSPVHAEFHAGAPVGPNRFPVSTFETSEDWAPFSGSTEPVTSTTHAHTGDRSLRLVRGAGTNALYAARNVHLLLPGPGEHQLAAWVWIPSSVAGTQHGLSVQGTGVVGNPRRVFTNVRDQWVQLVVPFTWDGVGGVALYPYGNDPSAQMWIDDVELHALGATVTFSGAVGALDGRPRRFRHPDTGAMVEGWQLDVQAVDYVSALAEYNVAGSRPTTGAITGDGPYPYALAADILAKADVSMDYTGSPPWWGDGEFGSSAQVVLSDEFESGTVADELENLLRTVVDRGSPDVSAVQGLRRGVIRSKLGADHLPDPAVPYVVEWISRRNPSTPQLNTLPGIFTQLPGGLYGPTIAAPEAADASVILSADYLARDVTWTRTKFTEPDRVIVANATPPELRQDPAPLPRPEDWAQVTVTQRGAGPRPVSAQLDAALWNRQDAVDLATMYLDDDATPDTAWQPAGFSWRASEDPSWPQRLSWFPGSPSWIGWAVPVVITDVPAAQQPNSRPWQVGVPAQVDLVIESGRFRFDFTLRPRIPRPYVNGSAFSCADLAAEFPTVTYDQLDPSFTSTDYRLLRTTTAPAT